MDTIEQARLGGLAAEDHLNVAIQIIDGRFGDGYSRTHQDFVAAFMTTAGLGHIGESLVTVSEAIKSVNETLTIMQDSLDDLITNRLEGKQ